MKSLTETSGTLYKVILNTSVRSQNLCVYHVLCCRKKLACAKWMNQIKHCHRNNVEALLKIA